MTLDFAQPNWLLLLLALLVVSSLSTTLTFYLEHYLKDSQETM